MSFSSLGILRSYCSSPSTVEDFLLKNVTFLCPPWFLCQRVFPPPHSPSGKSILHSVSDLLFLILSLVLTPPLTPVPKTTLPHFVFEIMSELLTMAARVQCTSSHPNPVAQQNSTVHRSPNESCHFPPPTGQCYFPSHGLVSFHPHFLESFPFFKTHFT